MRHLWREHGLAVTAFLLFFVFWAFLSFSGYREYNQTQQEYGLPEIAYWSYLGTGHFWEATFENWESEYLQAGVLLLLTAHLFEKGSAESRTMEERAHEKQQEELEERERRGPWPLRHGRVWRVLYENSLSIVLLLIFVLTFIAHGISGVQAYNREQLLSGQATVTLFQYMTGPTFWFESFQNWQSEFLSIFSMIVLSIFLRQKGSSESKPVGKTDSENAD